MTGIEQQVEQIAAPIAEQCGCSIYDVEFKREGPSWFLRVYIDRPGGVSVEDCESVSKRLSKALDEADPIQQAYYLEVSSPGMDRRLKYEKHFLDNLGKTVDVKLKQAVNGKRKLKGELHHYENGTVTVIVDGETVSFDQSQAANIKLHVDLFGG